MRVLILHGWGGSDYPHWQSKLACKIAKNYGTVAFPKLSNFDNPMLDNWLKELDKIIKEFKPTVVVCHSLANNLWFWYMNNSSYKLDKLFLVAIPSLNTKEEALNSFFPCPKPKTLGAKEVYIVASTNDPWCKIEEVKELAKIYNAKLKILKDAGHINADSGFGDWEWIESFFAFGKKAQS